MKIANQLPHFRNERALLIVTGAQDAVLYFANDGIITKEAALKVDKPHFSDKEGFFKSRGHGKGFGATSPEAPIKEAVVTAMLRELKTKLASVLRTRKPTKVYLFTPAYLAPRVKDELGKTTGAMLARIIRGDYSEAHPFELLKKLQAPR